MSFRLPSYKPDGRNHCYYSTGTEPCWGPVEFRDCYYSDEPPYEEEEIHACEAHEGCYSFVTPWVYKPSPYPEDQGVTPVETDP